MLIIIDFRPGNPETPRAGSRSFGIHGSMHALLICLNPRDKGIIPRPSESTSPGMLYSESMTDQLLSGSA
jgi:hypothetical protein